MKTYLLNPTLKSGGKYIREGRCMQKASSWATVWPPITLALLGTLAQKHGPAKVFDGNVEEFTLEDLLADLRAFDPDVVLINTGFPSIEDDMAVGRAVKEAFPKAMVVAFGVYFTMLEQEGYLHYPFLDAAIVGEPEATFAELLLAWDRPRPSLAKIRGLIYKDPQGVHVNEPRPLIENLDTLPVPDRRLLKNDRYRLPNNNRVFTLINSARGCPYRCTFCIVDAYYGHKVRKHSVDYLIKEIKQCQEDFGIQDFLFWEEAFALNKKYVLEFCAALKRENLRIGWAATTRVDSLDEEIVAAMKGAGCYLLGLGIESGSQAILDAAKKKQTLDQIRRAVNLCRRAGLQTMGHFIFGLPGETQETAEQTIRFMLDLGIDYMQCYCAVPYPKTELGDLARREGWVMSSRWADFDFGGNSIMRTDQLTCEAVDSFRRKAFSRFYFRPGYILKKIFFDVSVRQILKLANFSDWMNLLGVRGGKK